MIDRLGNEVNIGDIVRVIDIPQCVLDTLDDEERSHIEAMLNNEYEIDDLPEPGKVSVSIWWVIDEGVYGHGGLYMLSHEFELVRKGSEKSECNVVIR